MILVAVTADSCQLRVRERRAHLLHLRDEFIRPAQSACVSAQHRWARKQRRRRVGCGRNVAVAILVEQAEEEGRTFLAALPRRRAPLQARGLAPLHAARRGGEASLSRTYSPRRSRTRSRPRRTRRSRPRLRIGHLSNI